ncbi:uncharacterized protein BT62DRAFT_1000545 [Guyanagaster necrorhizus]|uniref:Uncharacterized protein n=1 Tax=Guyanagaster necrorhizus TaxID=856835 RepID=A0A9P7W3A3_9AGAR|nr:uncharacterized protein BT62DRAFT_1000545 [Guyanagaster necrorhizus MCA 3950]KAG7451304.1 hypothetical protein BT62DRAFT_1000545 [Guyanagaster necrorhizus MCA 3950]
MESTPTAPQVKPNIFSKHTIVLDHPVSKVFPILGTAKNQEKIARACSSSLPITAFRLLNKDVVAIPRSTPLSGIRDARDLPAAQEFESESKGARQLPRQFFAFTETQHMLCQTVSWNMGLEATLVWDEEAMMTLYESRVTGKYGIRTWKLREMEEIEGGMKTRVTETLEGVYSGWNRKVVQKKTRQAHVNQMELFHTFFD